MENRLSWIKKVYWSGHFLWAAFFILSIYYYQERIAFLDASLYLFEMVRTAGGAVFHDRFISLFTQWLPWIAIQGGWSLKTVAILYSVSFPLFFLICYWICGALKAYRLGLALLLYLCLMTSHNFFWHLSELTLGTAMLFPVVAFICRHGDKKLSSALVLGLSFPVLVFAHPLLIFPFIFTWIFFFRGAPNPKFKPWFWIGIAYYVGLVVLKQLLFKEAYESQAFGGLKNFIYLFPRYDRAVSMGRFVQNLLPYYYFIPLSFGLLAAFYISRKRWIDLLFVSGFLMGFGLLVMVSYPDPQTEDFYLENLYFPMAFFLALPLVYHAFPWFQNPRIPAILVASVGLACLIRILSLAEVHEDRTRFHKEVLAEYGHGKFVFDTDYLPADRLYMTWASPYEFWFISTVETGQTASILITEDTAPFEYAWDQRAALVTTWGSFPYESLPEPYFRFSDRAHGYQILKGAKGQDPESAEKEQGEP